MNDYNGWARYTAWARLYWVSEDGRNSLYMGDYPSETEARAAIPRALEDLIAVGSADDEAALRAGSWSIE